MVAAVAAAQRRILDRAALSPAVHRARQPFHVRWDGQWSNPGEQPAAPRSAA